MKKFILAAFLILGLLASGCGGAPTEKKADEKLTVVVSFNAMKEFTQAVGGDAIHVVSLIPEGTEPHGFSPTADQMKTLSQADPIHKETYKKNAASYKKQLQSLYQEIPI